MAHAGDELRQLDIQQRSTLHTGLQRLASVRLATSA